MIKVFLSGRLTRNVKYKNLGRVEVAVTSVAVDRSLMEGESYVFNIVAFGKTALFLHRYFAKGSKLLLEGHLHFNSYEKDGKKLSSVTVVADSLEFADSKKKAAEHGDFNGEDIPPDDTPF